MKRKDFIRNSAALSGAIVTGMVASSCGLFIDAELELCPETEIEEGQFKTFLFNRRQILVRRVNQELEIISLTCTHRRCTVAFKAEEKIFACPCHEGTYDFEGRVIDGPPPFPLLRFNYEIREGVIWVLNQYLRPNR